MRDRRLHIILAILFLASISIPSWLWIRDYLLDKGKSIDSTILSEFASFQSFIIAFWSLILNLILVIIAFRAFQNFDVKKQFHNKQLEIVSELTSAISSLDLSNMFYETKTSPDKKEHQIATGFTSGFFELSFGFNYTDKGIICIKSNNIENTFPFLRYRKHPLLPRSISSKLDKLYRPLHYSLPIKKDELPKDYVLLYSKELSPEDYSREWIYEYYKQPGDYSGDCLELKNAIVNWYKKFGADDLTL